MPEIGRKKAKYSHVQFKYFSKEFFEETLADLAKVRKVFYACFFLLN